jgi:hypothetical protein
MSTSMLTRMRARRPVDTSPSRPALTAMVFFVTLAVSVAALVSPALMRLFVRDLPQLRAGQWWRVVTPVVVQPSGWGQLVFNLLGIAVVGCFAAPPGLGGMVAHLSGRRVGQHRGVQRLAPGRYRRRLLSGGRCADRRTCHPARRPR